MPSHHRPWNTRPRTARRLTPRPRNAVYHAALLSFRYSYAKLMHTCLRGDGEAKARRLMALRCSFDEPRH